MCIFCEIVKGDIPSSIVYEDEDTLAILDLSQTTKGHTLVMPKKHYNNFLEMPEEEFKALAGKAQKIGKLLMEKLHAEGMNALINTNEVAGQTIMHTHIHLIPRYSANDTVSFSFSENHLDLNEVLNEIKA